MSLLSQDQMDGFVEPYGVGPVAQCYPPFTPAPGAIAASGEYQSAVLPTNGFKALTVAAQLTGSGSLSVQRFVDLAGTIPQGAPVTTSLAANAYGVVNITDGLPAGSYQVTVTNSSGGAETLTGLVIYQEAR